MVTSTNGPAAAVLVKASVTGVGLVTCMREACLALDLVLICTHSQVLCVESLHAATWCWCTYHLFSEQCCKWTGADLQDALTASDSDMKLMCSGVNIWRRCQQLIAHQHRV